MRSYSLSLANLIMEIKDPSLFVNGFVLASFPVPRPAFRRLQYGKRQKAGRGTGYEARFVQHA